jgi:hypothetical protein
MNYGHLFTCLECSTHELPQQCLFFLSHFCKMTFEKMKSPNVTNGTVTAGLARSPQGATCSPIARDQSTISVGVASKSGVAGTLASSIIVAQIALRQGCSLARPQLAMRSIRSALCVHWIGWSCPFCNTKRDELPSQESAWPGRKVNRQRNRGPSKD